MAKEKPAVPEKAAKFSKAQILRSDRYAKRRDLLSAILEDGKNYSVEEIDSKISKFLKGKVH